MRAKDPLPVGEHEFEAEPRTYRHVRNESVHSYLSSRGNVPVAALLAKIDQVAPGIPLDHIFLNGPRMEWDRPPTEEEQAQWVEQTAQWNANAKEARRRQYDRLRAEFEDDDA